MQVHNKAGPGAGHSNTHNGESATSISCNHAPPAPNIGGVNAHNTTA